MFSYHPKNVLPNCTIRFNGIPFEIHWSGVYCSAPFRQRHYNFKTILIHDESPHYRHILLYGSYLNFEYKTESSQATHSFNRFLIIFSCPSAIFYNKECARGAIKVEPTHAVWMNIFFSRFVSKKSITVYRGYIYCRTGKKRISLYHDVILIKL